MQLSGKHRRFLRALGHHLKPSLSVGKQGVTPELIQQFEQCLLAHELVKVKVLEACSHPRSEVGSSLAEASAGAVAQILGRILLIYRPHPEEPRIKLPE